MLRRHLRRLMPAPSLLPALVGAFLLPLALQSAQAAPTQPAPRRSEAAAPRDIPALFGEEMQQAAAHLQWRGEHLTEDTLYAVALTGLSWEPAWGREHLFSLAWGDGHKVPTLGHRFSKDYTTLVKLIQQAYVNKDYHRAIGLATTNFTLDEIGCDANLKEPVGYSLLALGQPEQAFPVFAAPFEPSKSVFNAAELNRKFREAAFDAATRAGLTREAIAFALSLLLEPGIDAPTLHQASLKYLEESNVDIDKILRGILQAPSRLRGLPAYTYAASDLLAYRANPRLIPFLLHLAGSDDVYLHSRAVIGLGIAAYQPRSADPKGWTSKVVLRPLQQYGLSAAQRQLIDKEIQEAARSDKYRLRASAALALALIGSDASVPLLQQMAKDRSYVLATDPDLEDKQAQAPHLFFPVRLAAAAGLERYGVKAGTGGEYTGKEIETARRGNQDDTNDRRGLIREIASQIYVTPLDTASASPVAITRK